MLILTRKGLQMIIFYLLRYGHGYIECHGGHLGVTSRLPEIAATQLCDGPAYAGWWQEGHPAVKNFAPITLWEMKRCRLGKA
mgnify:CR=1 FL=1